ncbi:hypothetical protein MG293_010287 [Ovis ammon polii]|uniref:Uncharacterized protein n=1 Tax=Ovis ammon polii TaxID=230172 RepID=A0AAD4YAA2_OVIAM|nr:hypothetical protein MG293_010287 [Ovis ammon polii]
MPRVRGFSKMSSRKSSEKAETGFKDEKEEMEEKRSEKQEDRRKVGVVRAKFLPPRKAHTQGNQLRFGTCRLSQSGPESSHWLSISRERGAQSGRALLVVGGESVGFSSLIMATFMIMNENYQCSPTLKTAEQGLVHQEIGELSDSALICLKHRATAKLSVIMVKKIDSILSRSPFLAHQSGKILLGSDAIRVIVQKRKELRCLSEQWGLTVLFSDEPHRHRVEGQSVLRLRKFTASQQKEMSKYPEGRDCCDKGKPLSAAPGPPVADMLRGLLDGCQHLGCLPVAGFCHRAPGLQEVCLRHVFGPWNYIMG